MPDEQLQAWPVLPDSHVPWPANVVQAQPYLEKSYRSAMRLATYHDADPFQLQWRPKIMQGAQKGNASRTLSWVRTNECQ